MNKVRVLAERIPAPGETCAVTSRPYLKQAALLFDRVLLSCGDHSYEFFDGPEALTFGIQQADDIVAKATQEKLDKLIQAEDSAGMSHLFQSEVYQLYTETYREFGIEVIPIYSSERAFQNDTAPGPVIGYQAAMSQVSLVSPDGANWDQIVDFREDKDALRKYRALRNWLRHGLKASSVAEATDIISQKLEDYEWAIRKHDLKTITGTLASVLDSKQLLALSSASGAAGLVGGAIWAAVTAGIILFAGVSVKIADRLVELEDVKRGANSEVAVIYDIRRRFRRS